MQGNLLLNVKYRNCRWDTHTHTCLSTNGHTPMDTRNHSNHDLYNVIGQQIIDQIDFECQRYGSLARLSNSIEIFFALMTELPRSIQKEHTCIDSVGSVC